MTVSTAHQSPSSKHSSFIHLPPGSPCTSPSSPVLSCDTTYSASFLSPFFLLLVVCSLLGSVFLHPPHLPLFLPLSTPLSVLPCHKNELNLSPLVQTTIDGSRKWGGVMLENKSACRPFWGSRVGGGHRGMGPRVDEEQVGWRSGGRARLLTCHLHSGS